MKRLLALLLMGWMLIAVSTVMTHTHALGDAPLAKQACAFCVVAASPASLTALPRLLPPLMEGVVGPQLPPIVPLFVVTVVVFAPKHSPPSVSALS